VTPDPVGFSDGPNLYTYVRNGPLVLIDSYGLTTLEDSEGTDGENWLSRFNDDVENSHKELERLHNSIDCAIESGREYLHGDFSRLKDTPWAEISNRVGTEGVHAICAAAVAYPAGRVLSGVFQASSPEKEELLPLIPKISRRNNGQHPDAQFLYADGASAPSFRRNSSRAEFYRA
jgi:hypothetical protein